MMKFVNHARRAVCLSLLVGLGLAHAGSYEDFFSAIKENNVGKTKTLLARGFDPNTLNPKKLNGLYIALTEPSLDVAQVLIAWPKTDVNMLNPKGESPLMMAAIKGYPKLARQLIDKGADVNKTGWTPLHYAATSGQLSVISLLLESNAYIDAESPNGTTPLMMAAMYGTPAAVKLLLQEGADAQLKNQQGLTALDFAQRAQRPDAIEALAAAIRRKQPLGQW